MSKELGKASQSIEQGVKKVVDYGIGGVGKFKGASAVADECLTDSGFDVEDAVRRAIKLHVRYATTSGGVLGLGGLITLPVTLPASMASLYVINARMTATIAQLRGYDLASEEVRTIMLVTLLGAGGANAMKETGITIGNKSVLAAVKKVPGKTLIEINKRVGFRLFTKAGQTGVVNMTKLVPLVGAPIGATADYLATKSLAKYALRNFPPLQDPIEAAQKPPA